MMNTERLVLEKLTEKKTHFILELLNTNGWLKYIGNRNIHCEEDAKKYIQKINQNPNTTYWTVRLKEAKIAIDSITVIKRNYLKYKDIGFAFLPEFANKGYAYEASKAVLEDMARNSKTETILAITVPENIASIKLIKKLGLSFQKTFENDNEILNLYSGSLMRLK